MFSRRSRASTAMADAVENQGSPKKQPAMLIMAAGVLTLSVLGAGAGWFLGTMIAPNIKSAEEVVATETASAGGEERKEAEGGLSTHLHRSKQHRSA